MENKTETDTIKTEIEGTRVAIENTEDGEMIPILERLLREQKAILDELEKSERIFE